ncbi:unnamed protein product [Pseudo-nitzschia multistriata]|uniref:Uncharacterized protein n=1 Tax=Pseudo-nitzschia multistriata TaxID=183589 RepID=A0A448ZCF8_9STRA|nr:unnamed protein product [Pseudo-nitzschia multistriata]
MFRLSFPNGSPSAIVHARAPANSVESVNSTGLPSASLPLPLSLSPTNSIPQPITSAVPKHARQPATDEVRVPPFWSVSIVYNLGERIEDPIHDAIGSASARHSTAYRAIRMSLVTNPDIVIAVPIRK